MYKFYICVNGKTFGKFTTSEGAWAEYLNLVKIFKENDDNSLIAYINAETGELLADSTGYIA